MPKGRLVVSTYQPLWKNGEKKIPRYGKRYKIPWFQTNHQPAMSEKLEATGTKFTVMKQLAIARSVKKLMTGGHRLVAVGLIRENHLLITND